MKIGRLHRIFLALILLAAASNSSVGQVAAPFHPVFGDNEVVGTGENNGNALVVIGLAGTTDPGAVPYDGDFQIQFYAADGMTAIGGPQDVAAADITILDDNGDAGEIESGDTIQIDVSSSIQGAAFTAAEFAIIHTVGGDGELTDGTVGDESTNTRYSIRRGLPTLVAALFQSNTADTTMSELLLMIEIDDFVDLDGSTVSGSDIALAQADQAFVVADNPNDTEIAGLTNTDFEISADNMSFAALDAADVTSFAVDDGSIFITITFNEATSDLNDNSQFIRVAAAGDVFDSTGQPADSASVRINGNDCNGNGVWDDLDIADQTSADCNGNGVPDECEIISGALEDCDGDKIPDLCQIVVVSRSTAVLSPTPDSPAHQTFFLDYPTFDPVILTVHANADLGALTEYVEVTLEDQETIFLFQFDGAECTDLFTSIEVDPQIFNELISDGSLQFTVGVSDDVTPDWCGETQITVSLLYQAATEDDCNANGVPDVCDVINGHLQDLNGNWIADICEPDCNGNGVPDDVDIDMGSSDDCNMNQIPDECEGDVDGGDGDGCGGDNGPFDPCRADVNDDGSIDFIDLDLLLDAWSSDVGPGTGADIDSDGLVGFGDLNTLLDGWGQPCPSPLPRVVAVWHVIDNTCDDDDDGEPDLQGHLTADLYLSMDGPHRVLSVLSGPSLGNNAGITVHGGSFYQNPLGSNVMATPAQIDIVPCLAFDSYLTLGDVAPGFLFEPDSNDWGQTLMTGWFVTGVQVLGVQNTPIPDGRFYVRLGRFTVQADAASVAGEVEVGVSYAGEGSTQTIKVTVPELMLQAP